MSRFAFMLDRPRRTLAALATVLAATSLTVASGADFTAESASPLNTFATGTLTISNSSAGAAVLSAAGTVTAPSLAAQAGVTIYNDGRVLVRRSFPLQVPAGSSTQSIGVGTADPSTLFSLDPDVTIEGAAYYAAVDEPSVLRRSVGKRLVFRTGTGWRDGVPVTDTVSALVLGVDPIRLRMPDGRVMFSMPGQPQYPADLVLAS